MGFVIKNHETRENGRISGEEFRTVYEVYEGNLEKIAEALEKETKYVRKRCKQLHLYINREKYKPKGRGRVIVQDKYFLRYGTPIEFPKQKF